MAFESIPGVKIICRETEQTFICGDFFAVYHKGEDIPRIYRWNRVKSITETRFDFTVVVSGIVYRISKISFPDAKKLLNMRAVFESAVSTNPKIEYTHLKRILPPKNLYLSGDMSDSPYSAIGFYKEREINFSNVILLNTRLGRLFKLLALITITAIFILLYVTYGDAETNWIFFVPISFFAGGISVMLVYLVCAVIANFHFSYLYKVDPAINEEIAFAISEFGFAAIENSLYTNFEYIPWEEANYFIETNSVFIVYKHNKAVFWLPKRLFEKAQQIEISKFIATKLTQK